ncbi:MAG: hypothetical protein ACYCW6_25560, partial [Candidatus Xenobia bacterium]
MRTVKIGLTCLFSFGGLLLAFILMVTFLVNHTNYFINFGLLDPSSVKYTRAAHDVGVVILLGVTLLLGFVCYVLITDILMQFQSAGALRSRWKDLKVSYLGGTTSRQDVLQDLSHKVGSGCRLHRVLQIWLEGVNDSDTEALLEAASNAGRQTIGFCQTMASVLVLIGLMGNFFGLSRAVTVLPSLAIAAAPAQPRPAPSPTPIASSSTLPGNIKELTLKSPAESPTPQPTQATDLHKGVSDISDGLAVVVVSSVMGILGMIVVLFVSGLVKAQLSEALGEEQALIASEIGPVLAPKQDSRIWQNMDQLSKGLKDLPDMLSRLETATTGLAGSIDQSQGELKESLLQFDDLMKHELVEARNSYQGYQTALTRFHETLSDVRGMLRTLAESTQGLYQNLLQVSERVLGLTEETKKIYQSQSEA